MGPVGALAAGTVLVAGCAAASTSPPSSTAAPTVGSGIGAWPAFLPAPTTAGVAHGSTTSPAMSYPGSPVIVSTGSAEVTVEVDGPAYPADTAVGAMQVPCTFVVTFSAATASVNIGAARFDVLDHTGGVHPLKVASGVLPHALDPGRTATVRLVATLPSGEGLIRFYPSGTQTAAGWDYVAETD